ncbi:DUF962 domain-containing protein [Variovorax dokdonensis]|uniref:DUF962 domain-containing protein n=1 Tax=Variovorax dokdonensis TaxID=344883 RepID=A0ABT7NBJ0_9BURK|nr:Mpo1-like protein [Variovorax dokdonensis]MDM0045293.1 DUF962 domain-containing protein [Variovorax dokdonensis]
MSDTAFHGLGDEPTGQRPTSRLDRLLAHYGESHRHPTNELIHLIAIPAIMVSIVGLLYALHPWVAYAFVAASMVYYAMLRAPLLLAIMAVWTVAVFALVHAMGERVLSISAGIFIVGWIFQFIGHKIEGKKPSFFEDLQYLYVGPLFVVVQLLGRMGFKQGTAANRH